MATWYIYIYIYRSFATWVSQLKIWHFWVIGIEENVCRCTFNRYGVITQFEITTHERIHILNSSVNGRKVTDSYCHFPGHTGHMQTFRNRESECTVTHHAPLLIRDPNTRKQIVLGYMFVGSVFVCFGPKNTIWNRAAFFKKHPM